MTFSRNISGFDKPFYCCKCDFTFFAWHCDTVFQRHINGGIINKSFYTNGLFKWEILIKKSQCFTRYFIKQINIGAFGHDYTYSC